MKSPIVFERKEGRTGKAGGHATLVIQWNVVQPAGTGLAIRVDSEGINILGGTPAFDTQAEEKAWSWQVDMATFALRFIRQVTAVPDDVALSAMVRSSKEPE